MWAHRHATDDEAEHTVKARYSEPPRQAEYNWFPLAIVIYTWTDKRESEVDKTYWETASQDRSRSQTPSSNTLTLLEQLGPDRDPVTVAVSA